MEVAAPQTAESPPASLRWTEWVALVAALVAAGVLLAPVLGELAVRFDQTIYLGHGFVLPAASLVLAHGYRDEIRRAWRDASPPRWGALAVLACAVFVIAAARSRVITAAALGVPLVLASLAYAAGGRRLLRELAEPIGLLVFVVPPPGFLINDVLYPLKSLATKASVWLLHRADFLVAADGNQILIPGHTLFVADACSGVVSIITLLPLAAVVGVFTTPHWGKRALILASVVPLALLGNILRIAITVSLVDRYGVEFAQGSLHESFGLATFLLGTLALIGIGRLVR